MAAMIRPLLRCSRREASSSMANITPASGALNAAAMPAAPPATSRPCSDIPGCSGSQRRACCITPAAICTDGPSRPLASPPSSEPAVSTALATLRRSDTNWGRSVVATAGSSVAITCGMPEPAAPGAKRRVSHTTPAVQAVVHRSGVSGCSARMRANASCATSQSLENATTDRPAAAA